MGTTPDRQSWRFSTAELVREQIFAPREIHEDSFLVLTPFFLERDGIGGSTCRTYVSTVQYTVS